VNFETNDQGSPEFRSLNPYGKIPAILDPDGPDGKPLALFESGAILIYLAEKARQLLPQSQAARYETIQWLMFQVGGIGPCLARSDSSTNSPARISRTSVHATDMSRKPSVCSCAQPASDAAELDHGDEYSIADIATFPWIRNLIGFYGAGELVESAITRRSPGCSRHSWRAQPWLGESPSLHARDITLTTQLCFFPTRDAIALHCRSPAVTLTSFAIF